MKQITTIIPLNEYNETVKEMLKMAVESYAETNKNDVSDLMFVGPKEVLEQVKKDQTVEATYVEHEDSWFSSLINAAAKKVKTDYFSILEFDDEFSPIWFDNVIKYIDAGDNISVYLPLTEVFDYQHKEQGPIGYVNEAVWASSFSEQLGYFDNDCLQDL